MDPLLFLALASLVTGVVYTLHAQWLVSLPFFVLAVFFYLWPSFALPGRVGKTAKRKKERFLSRFGKGKGGAWKFFYSSTLRKKGRKNSQALKPGRWLSLIQGVFHARPAKEKAPPPLRPAWFRFLGLAVGVAAGWYGSWFITGPTLDWARGLPLIYLSAWGLLEAFPSQSRVTGGDAFPKATLKDRTPYVGFFFLVPLPWLAMEIFFHLGYLGAGIVFLALSAFLIAVLRRHRRETLSPSPWAFEAKALLLLLAAAALLRYPFLNHLFTGFQLDEALDALAAADVVKGDITDPFRTGWSGSPVLPFFLKAAVYKVLGVNLAATQFFSLTFSLLSVYVFYRWCRLYFGPRACLAAALLFSVSWWHLYFAFSPFSVICTLLFELLTFYFLERAFQGGQRSHFWWAGMFMAASVMSYLSGRFIPLMVLFFLVGCGLAAGRLPFLRAYGKPLLLSFLAMLLFLGSFIRFCASQPQEFFGRMETMNIFNEVARTGNHWLPVKTTLWTLLSFFWTTKSADDRFIVVGTPLLDPFTGLLLLTGFILTLFALNQRASWAALSGLIFGVAANALSSQGVDASVDYVNAMRMFFIFPFLMLMVARACQWLWEIFDQVRPRMKSAAKALLGAGLLSALVLNADTYYFRFHVRPANWGEMGYHHVAQAKVDKELIATCHLIVNVDSYSAIIEFFTGINPLQVTQVSDDLPLPILNPVEKDVAVMFPPQKLKGFQKDARRYYPHAVENSYQDPWGGVYLDIIRIPKADIEAAQKGHPLGKPLP